MLIAFVRSLANRYCFHGLLHDSFVPAYTDLPNRASLGFCNRLETWCLLSSKAFKKKSEFSNFNFYGKLSNMKKEYFAVISTALLVKWLLCHIGATKARRAKPWEQYKSWFKVTPEPNKQGEPDRLSWQRSLRAETLYVRSYECDRDKMSIKAKAPFFLPGRLYHCEKKRSVNLKRL